MSLNFGNSHEGAWGSCSETIRYHSRSLCIYIVKYYTLYIKKYMFSALPLLSLSISHSPPPPPDPLLLFDLRLFSQLRKILWTDPLASSAKDNDLKSYLFII